MAAAGCRDGREVVLALEKMRLIGEVSRDMRTGRYQKSHDVEDQR